MASPLRESAMLVAFAACRHSVPPLPAGPVSRPSRAILWQWDASGSDHALGSAAVSIADGRAVYTFLGSSDGTRSSVTKLLPVASAASGATLLWRATPPDTVADDDAALLPHGGVLYLAHFSDISDGCTVAAYDAATGRLLWKTRLVGLGPVSHSKYYNRVELHWIGGRVVAFGDETAGRYIEELDPATGATVSNHRLRPVR